MEGFFQPREQEHEAYQIHGDMQQIHMQKAGRNQPPHLSPFDKNALNCPVVDQDLLFDLQDILILLSDPLETTKYINHRHDDR